MHSSRMRTVRCTDRREGGLSARGGLPREVCAQGVIYPGDVCPAGEGCAQGCVSAQGMSAQGHVSAQGVSAFGGLSARGCLPRGYLPEGCLPRGGVSAPVHAGIHSPLMNRMTDACENITFP